MTDVEFIEQDDEVMNMVNSAASPATQEAAEQLARALGAPADDFRKQKCAQTKGKSARCRKARLFWLGAKVLSCIAIAGMLLAALRYPGLVIHVINVGILCCGVVAAVSIDRQIRR